MADPARFSVVMVGGTGAVGGETVRALLAMPELERLTLLGRRPVDGVDDERVRQHTVDVLDPSTYEAHLAGHDTAISTLGVGEPSAMSKEQFLRIDRDANVDFGTHCHAAGVSHFELLGSVGTNPRSMSYYLRSKGELEDALIGLGFPRLSLFRPSMIMTPTNRYGVSQAVALAMWPTLSRLMVGGAAKYRGIAVEDLGRAIAHNIAHAMEGDPADDPGRAGVEILRWPEMIRLAAARP